MMYEQNESRDGRLKPCWEMYGVLNALDLSVNIQFVYKNTAKKQDNETLYKILNKINEISLIVSW